MVHHQKSNVSGENWEQRICTFVSLYIFSSFPIRNCTVAIGLHWVLHLGESSRCGPRLFAQAIMNMRRFIKRTRTTHHVDNVDQRHFVYLPPCSNAMKLADHVSDGIDQRRGRLRLRLGCLGLGQQREFQGGEKGCWLALGCAGGGRGRGGSHPTAGGGCCRCTTVPGYISDFSFWRAGSTRASTSFDEKRCTWVHFPRSWQRLSTAISH